MRRAVEALEVADLAAVGGDEGDDLGAVVRAPATDRHDEPDVAPGSRGQPGLDLGDGRVRLDTVEDDWFDSGVPQHAADPVDDVGRRPDPGR